MNINEFNKIEEGISSLVRGMFSGQGNAQTRAQDVFIKDFMQDIMTSINNGVKGGLVDVGAKPGSPTAPADTTNAPAGNQPAKVGEPAASTAPQTQYMGKIAPDARPATKPAAPANPLTAPTIASKNVTTKVSPGGTPGSITKGGPTFTKESKYHTLNRIFESIVNIDEQEEKMPLADFLMSWYTQYMQGTDWQGSKPIVQNKINAIAKEYPNNLKNNLKSLAQMSLALSKSGAPAGAPAEFMQIQQAGAKSLEQGMAEIQQFLSQLSKQNPAAYNKLIKTLQPVPEPGASAGLVAEGKRKKK